jgi:hypothetical protein
MVRGFAVALFAVAVVAVAVPVTAHHSGAMFDEKKTITVEGTVKEFQYTNPHSWLLVDVKNKDGSVTTWGFEAEGPTTLQRAGRVQGRHEDHDYRPPDEGRYTRCHVGVRRARV